MRTVETSRKSTKWLDSARPRHSHAHVIPPSRIKDTKLMKSHRQAQPYAVVSRPTVPVRAQPRPLAATLLHVSGYDC